MATPSLYYLLPCSGPWDPFPTPSLLFANNFLSVSEKCFLFLYFKFKSVAYGMDSRPPMAIFELLDYIVNEVSTVWLP